MKKDGFVDVYKRQDTYLVYPGREDDGIVNRNMVVPSIRFETIRDGIEDFDLLTIREERCV